MILICDNSNSDRALQLRQRVMSAGIPCAISSTSSIKDYLPIQLILTFADTFEEIRRLPYDEVFVIAIGDGFINTALNAVGACNIDTTLLYAQKYLYSCLEADNKDLLVPGICTRGIYLGEKFFEVFGNIVVPTDTQYMIFKYLLTCTSSQVFSDTDKIRKFCYSTAKKIESNVIAAHISILNKKIYDAYGKKLIKSKRFNGYYIDKI